MAEATAAPPPPPLEASPPAVSLATIAREWGRIGVTGFGGPPAHIALLRKLCVEDRGWIDEEAFEHAVAATSLLPGPASTQLAIYCARRVAGTSGALVGGACFIVPGLIVILALSALFLSGSPPDWVSGAAAGAGASVAAVAVHTGLTIGRPIWERAHGTRRVRVAVYALASAAVAATAGRWLVLALLACGAAELLVTRLGAAGDATQPRPEPPAARPAVKPPRSSGANAPSETAPALAPLGLVGTGGVAGLGWTALKVGALSFGGGFVIVPLMQSDAVSVHHWMTGPQFLTAVALGQITPGPVVLTIAAIGFAAGGVAAGVLAALIAFAPSFVFVLGGSGLLERAREDARATAFMAGAAPAAAGAILGASIPLAGAIGVWWQGVVLAGAAIALLIMRAGVVEVMLGAAAIGAIGALTGASLPT